MKNLLLIILTVFTISCFSQTESDIKEILIEQIEFNPVNRYYKNTVVLNTTFLKESVGNWCGFELSDEVFENVFGVAQRVYQDKNYNKLMMTTINIVTIGSIRKIATTRASNNGDYYYRITLYTNEDTPGREFYQGLFDPERKSITKFNINIGDNQRAAEIIKKAIIDFGKLKGVTITDGDFY